MCMKEDNIQIIVLAAGHGKRMQNNELPKVLIPLHGKPLIQWLLEAIKQSGVCDTPAIIIGQKAEMVQQALGSDYMYVLQTEQLGTGHAVLAARSQLENSANHIMVLYGDHPSVTSKMIQNVARTHKNSQAVLTMATVTVDDFNDWRQSFHDYGRIIRDPDGKVTGIIERKDTTPNQQEIKEVNPGYYCFNADWLWKNLDQLRNENTQQEYYLTDLVAIACRQGNLISTVAIDPREALGVNTPEQLRLVEQVLID